MNDRARQRYPLLFQRVGIDDCLLTVSIGALGAGCLLESTELLLADVFVVRSQSGFVGVDDGSADTIEIVRDSLGQFVHGIGQFFISGEMIVRSFDVSSESSDHQITDDLFHSEQSVLHAENAQMWPELIIVR